MTSLLPHKRKKCKPVAKNGAAKQLKRPGEEEIIVYKNSDRLNAISRSARKMCWMCKLAQNYRKKSHLTKRMKELYSE